MSLELDERLKGALMIWGESCYRDGLQHGVQAVERIRGWLTRQPDRKWQAEVRGWVDELLKELNNTIDIDYID